MRTIKILSLFVFCIFFTSCNGQTKNEKQVQKSQGKSVSKIEVLDFHSTRRCMTCNAIEDNTKFTLETYFADEMKNGKITFESINVDKKKNSSLAQKFKAAGTSLFLNVIKNGTETQINLTDFAFMKGTDQDKFSSELKSKIKSELVKL